MFQSYFRFYEIKNSLWSRVETFIEKWKKSLERHILSVLVLVYPFFSGLGLFFSSFLGLPKGVFFISTFFILMILILFH